MEICDTDGLTLIDDGVSTVSALQQIQQDWKSGVVADLPANLENIIKHGLECDVIKYVDPSDFATRVRFQAMRHDADANRCRWTNLLTIQQVVQGWSCSCSVM